MKRITQADIQRTAHGVYDAVQAMRVAADALHANRTPDTLAAFHLANAAHTAAYAAHAAVVTAHADAQARKANDRHYKRLAALHKNRI